MLVFRFQPGKVRHGRPTRRALKARVSLHRDLWLDQRIRHVIDSQQFSKKSLGKIFETARRMETVKRGSQESGVLDGYIMATLFYEPSTRTRLSFESAMTRLGGVVLTTESAKEYSSASKGETLEGNHSRSLTNGHCGI